MTGAARTRRLTAALAVALLLPIGGAVDLCACEPTEHGLFCTPQPACCSQSAPAEEGVEDGCDCPSLLLAEAPPRHMAADGPPCDADLLRARPPALCLGRAEPPLLRSFDELARPPPRGPRKHLLLSVFLC